MKNIGILFSFLFVGLVSIKLSAQTKADSLKQFTKNFIKDSTGALGLRAKCLAVHLNKETTTIGSIDFTGFNLQQLIALFGKPNKISNDKDGKTDFISYDVNRKKGFAFYIYFRNGEAFQTEYVDLY